MGVTSVTIIVPVWGPSELTDACLESLVWSCTDYDLVVIDNTRTYEPKVTPGDHFTIVRNAENVGFAKACNQGADLATTDIVLFLNNDATGTLDWLANLMEAFDDYDVVAAGPRIVHPDGSLQTSGVRTWHGGGSAGGEELKDDLPTRDVDAVTGACLAVRRDVFNALGQFDTGFINGYEDVDLCLQLRGTNCRIRYVAESQIVHKESASGPERWAHVYENIAYMNAKWGNR